MASNLPPITRMLKTWREQRDPRAMPGFTARYGSRQRKGLTQRDMADLTGVTEGYYGKLERGQLDNVGTDFLKSVSRVLDLDEAQQTHLWLEVYGFAPPPRRHPDLSTIDPVVAAIVHELPWPAYTFDHRWDIRAFNEQAARDYPWMLHGVNVMIWALTYREARLQLKDWLEKWAKPMASQLRLSAKAHPDDARLKEVCAEIRKDEVARRILDDDVTSVTHPDGDRRRLYLPHQEEEVEVEFVALGRLSNNTRLMVVMPASIRQDVKDAIPSTIAQVPEGTPSTPASV
ncbi:helix-turn-helix domain-containing protein [Streptomyces sp. RGM 3693]|uniref:helix-turn-helix domain-containing protein n=1 Tax=Streptomyces sp. RGM 3693 TaxID=3413284 RepID=UPI003D2752CC